MANSSTDPMRLATDASKQVQQLALRFGGGVGIVCILWIVGLHLTGNNAFGPKQLLAELMVPFVALASEWTLRRQLLPAKPGLWRSLTVGGLTTLLAAMLSAGSVWALGQIVGESTLARHRAEIVEIIQTQQQANSKDRKLVQLTPAQRATIAGITVNDLAVSNFKTVLLFGLVFSLPGGIFFRE